MATRVLRNANVVMTNAMDKNDMQYVSSAVVNDGFQTSFGESTLLSTMNPSFGSKVNVEEGVWSTRISELKNPNSFDVEETLLSNKGNDDSSIAIPTSSFPSFAEVSRSYTNSSGESRNEVNLVPSMFDTNSKSVCSMEGITPTGWTFGEHNDLHNEPSSDSPFVKSVDINIHPTSYAGATGVSNSEQLKSMVNFHPMVAEKVFDSVNIYIPQKVVEKVSGRFENTLYGYFIGKRMAFTVVEYYARNNWAKHGLKRIMMNAKGFFFFKFDTRVGLDVVLEGGPWMIRNSPIILKKWSMNSSLQKEELARIPIWVKLHDVPIQVFEEDGISLIATGESYPKKVVANPVANATNDGFQQIMNKKRNNKKSSAGNKIPKGVPIAKGFQVGKEFNYQPKATSTGPNGGGTRGETSSKAGSSLFSNEGTSLAKKGNAYDGQKDKDVDDDEDDDIENVYDESTNLNLDHTSGASTPANIVPDVYVCAILESHVDVLGVYATCKKVCHRWKWTSNGNICNNGSRIILGWNDDIVDVMIMAQTNQVMHVQINIRIENTTETKHKSQNPSLMATQKTPPSNLIDCSLLL
ncbi:zinc knuckle CX2CX4HX4C containing protein [Tanacetum coccineum]